MTLGNNGLADGHAFAGKELTVLDGPTGLGELPVDQHPGALPSSQTILTPRRLQPVCLRSYLVACN